MSIMPKSRRAPLAKAFALLLAGLWIAQAPLRAEGMCGPSTNVKVIVYYDGTVTLWSDWRNNWTQLCNLDQPWGGVSTSTCFAWFAKVNAAINDGKPVSIWYNLDPLNCATLPVYGSAPVPVYIE